MKHFKKAREEKKGYLLSTFADLQAEKLQFSSEKRTVRLTSNYTHKIECRVQGREKEE